ncbi:VWA domain-containing protein [Zunongwangia endophytica]|uniref:VWA domain-containing protein n=1 Tax=Zunongwangia endophytica TaxID=1808945 RepID=A0ABV8H6L0_9FLAO|nr:VWA domain-containing protein [Zunongwangia endophytica]MDN3594491.1 VWA domain-containing protein [Zunongwangia endophytica]
MTLLNIIYITLAVIFALGFSYFQYFVKSKRSGKERLILFILRALGVFALLLLLIDPKITTTKIEREKPNLVLALDNSESISHLNQEKNIAEITSFLTEDDEINQQFDVQNIYFGNNILSSDSANFSEKQTDIFKALNSLKSIYKNKQTATILVTDGNQTLGRDFQYFDASSNQKIFPIVVGDTTKFPDLSISKLNVNRYAFLENKFPVEIFLNYSGSKSVASRFQITTEGKTVSSENVDFSAEKKSLKLEVNLPASKLGTQAYSAEILPLDKEKNTVNNQNSFAVEVIDERTSVLILSSISHPDLGALKKAIEQNKQRISSIKYASENNIELNEYQLVIIYQPNDNFNNYLKLIEGNNLPYLLVTGTKTNWNIVNNSFPNLDKSVTEDVQDFYPIMNSNFNQFQFEDIGFSNLSPLQDKFGDIKITDDFSNILYQKIESVETNQPLLITRKNNGIRSGFLFGENIWRWRNKVYVENQSFEKFDNFIGAIVQNLASKNKKERLNIDYESFYYSNEIVKFDAQFFDENYQFDPNANLQILVENDSLDLSFDSRFLLQENFYQVSFNNLQPGDYHFTVTEKNSGLNKSGEFSIIAFNVEQQFSSANLSKLENLASRNNTRVYFKENLDELKRELLNDTRFSIIRKANKKSRPLIDWYYLLFIIVAILAAEWFYRKYKGLI